MKIIRPREDELPAEGGSKATIVSVRLKPTKKGKLKFLTCSITPSGVDQGKEVDFLIPKYVPKDSNFHRFIVSVIGPQDTGNDVEPKRLVGHECLIEIKHVKKWGHVFANVIDVSAVE